AGLRMFRHAQFHQRDQAAEVLIPRTVSYQHWNGDEISVWTFHTDLGADVRLESILASGKMKPRRSVNAVAIEQRHRRHVEIERGGDQFLRHGGAFQKTKSRTSM